MVELYEAYSIPDLEIFVVLLLYGRPKVITMLLIGHIFVLVALSRFKDILEIR